MENTTCLTVVKSNKVIEASYRLTLAEQRVLLACIAQIDAKVELSKNHRFEITAAEVADLVGQDDLGNTYRDLKNVADKLYERSIIINDPEPDNPLIKQRKMRWLSSIDYMPGTGKLGLKFSADIIPYLSQLSREFTQYKLQHVTRFESVYSIRLYELLVQWRSTGEREIEVEWLKRQFQVADKYDRVVNLKKRVIDPAVDEINQYSDLWVSYQQRKLGRTISHFRFKFGLKDTATALAKKRLSEADIKREARPGESRAEVIARFSGESLAEFAKPGETVAQVLERKNKLAEIKRGLA